MAPRKICSPVETAGASSDQPIELLCYLLSKKPKDPAPETVQDFLRKEEHFERARADIESAPTV